MTTYLPNELISASDLTNYLGKLKDNMIDKLAILNDEKIEAVVISKDKYERMQEALKQAEAKQILDSLDASFEDIKAGRVYPIDTLWDKI